MLDSPPETLLTGDAAPAPADAGPKPITDAAPRIPELSPAACATRLAELFPAVFTPQQPKPLKLRIQADLQQRAPGVFTRRVLSIFLHRHTTSTAYLKALAAAPHRFDLDGAPAGEVAPEHRDAAVAELQRRRSIFEERRAAERETQREAQREAHLEAQRQAQSAARQTQRAQREAQRAEREAQQQAQRKQQEAQREQVVQDEQQRELRALLHAFESSTLTKQNFCVLKRISEADLDARLALAKQLSPAPAPAFERPRGPAPAPRRRP